MKLLSTLVDNVFGYDYFLAYARADATKCAESISERLRARGFRVFIDRKEYVPGDELDTATLRRIRMSSGLILVLSPRALQSAWVYRELDTALDLERRVIAVDVESTFAEGERGGALCERLGSRIRIPDSGPLDAGCISSSTVDEIIRSYKKTRRESRLRRISAAVGITLTVSVVAAIALWALFRSGQEQVTDMRRLESAEILIEQDPTAAAAELVRLTHPLEGDWDWRRYSSLLARPLAQSILTTQDVVRFAAFGPQDGQLLVGAHDGSLWLHDASGDRKPAQVMGRRDDRIFVAGSATGDGTRVVAITESGEVWLCAPGEPGLQVGTPGEERRVWSASFGDGGRRIVTVDESGSAHVFHLDGDRTWSTLRGHPTPIRSACLSADGSTLASTGELRPVFVGSLEQPDTSAPLDDHGEEVVSAALSANGSRIVTLSVNGEVRYGPTDSSVAPAVAASIPADGFDPFNDIVVFNSDCTEIVVVSGQGLAWLFDTRGSTYPIPLTSESIAPYAMYFPCASFSPEGDRVVVVGPRDIRVWPTTSDPVLKAGISTGQAEVVSIAPDGRQILTRGPRGELYLAQVDGDEPATELTGHGEGILASTFATGGRRLVSVATDGTVRIGDGEDPAHATEISHLEDELHSAAFSPDGQALAWLSPDGSVRAARLEALDQQDPLWGISSYWIDGRGLVAISADLRFALVSTTTDGAHLLEQNNHAGFLMHGGHEIVSAGFDLGGECLATSWSDGTIRIYRLPDGVESGDHLEFRSRGLPSTGLAIDSVGGNLLVAYRNGALRKWPITRAAFLETLGSIEFAMPATGMR